MPKETNHSQDRLRFICSFFLWAALLLFIPAAYAKNNNAELARPVFRYGISETALWNSNPLKLRTNIQDVIGSETKVFAGIERETATTQIKADVSALHEQYDHSEYNTTDFYGRASLKRKFEKTTLNLATSYDFDTTRSSELTTFGQDIGAGRRQSFNIAPSVYYALSPRSTIGLTGKWQETRYDNNSLEDYRILSISPSISYFLTPLQTLVFSVQAQRYMLLESASDQYIDSIGPISSWEYNFLPEWSAITSLGYLASKAHGYATGSDDSWDYNPIYGLTLQYEGAQHTSRLSIIRSRQPYANGTETYLTSIEAADSTAINESMDFEIKGNYQFAKNSPLATNNLEKSWGGLIALNHKIGMNWMATASYKYQEETLSNRRDSADQQIVRVGLSYQFGKMQ